MRKSLQLLDGERMIIDRPIHWKNYITPFLGMTLCILMLILRLGDMDAWIPGTAWLGSKLPAAARTILSVVEVGVFVIIIIYCEGLTISISRNRYYLTDKRIVAVRGVFTIHQQEMLVRKCEMVYMSQSFYEHMYNCGDILCVSAGTTMFLDDVQDAFNFKQKLLALMSAEKFPETFEEKWIPTRDSLR